MAGSLPPCWLLAMAGCLFAPSLVTAAEVRPEERGKAALLSQSFSPGTLSVSSFHNAWRVWDRNATAPPADFDKLFRDRYGMHPAPYPNGGYPMGVRETEGFLGTKILTTDCMLCHGGAILGKSYVGLGNASLDLQAYFEEMAAVRGGKAKFPFQFCNVRGTNEAGATAVYLLGLREPDLKLRPQRLELGLRDDLCEDTPAWWLLKKKKTMYYTGGGNARSVRSLMQFMLSPLNGRETFDKQEATFRDIQAYLLSLEAPRYPFPIDQTLAEKGRDLFNAGCARCHGTYGEHWTYPNRIVPLAEIGTDPNRSHGISKEFARYYSASWFGREKAGWFGDDFSGSDTEGYQAPPLDGLWATAPYFHNGSAPTVYHVLKSKVRPRFYTRSFHTDEEDYDKEKLGWKIRVLQKGAGPGEPMIERRKIYDTTLPGRKNTGHIYGDRLSEEERMAVIEYLKTL